MDDDYQEGIGAWPTKRLTTSLLWEAGRPDCWQPIIWPNIPIETPIRGMYVAGAGPGVAGNIVSASATGLIPAKAILED